MKNHIKNLFLLPALIAALNLIPAGRVTAQTFTTLHSFTAYPDYPNTDGANPNGFVLSGNILYGTAGAGSSSQSGTVFKLNTDGTGFTTLYSFPGSSDGFYPEAGLVLSGNTLYGTTRQGGSSYGGTVFAVNTDGTGFTNLHSFSALNYNTNSDGIAPQAGLILSGNTLYGTAAYGGSSGNGTVFAVNTNGTGFTNLHNFTARDQTYNTNSDGAYPEAGLVLSNNTLYGTASGGGSSAYGTVFKVNTDGTGFTNLHSFTAVSPYDPQNPQTNSDGAIPQAGLILSGNILYGTAAYGGSLGGGTVFAVNTNGTGFTNLHSFTALNNNTNSDGAYLEAGLVLSNNTLCSTANRGGSSGEGTAFSLHTDGTGFTILHSFTAITVPSTNSDGATPYAGLITNSSGNILYGTAGAGGSSGNGTVFAVNTDGTGFTNLHSFTYSDGASPGAGLVLSGNTLYGTALYGGSSGNGTVFAVHTDGTGFTTLYSFTGGSDGGYPHPGLILSGNILYGTAIQGGSLGGGTVFAVHTDGTRFTNLHSFTGGSDGALPYGGLVLRNDILYGTASQGGSGAGMVFAVHTDGSGFTNVHSFTALSDGAVPYAGLILSGNTLYGTAQYGGSLGGGTVFAVHTDGTGFTNLHSFNYDSDGAYPWSGLIVSGNALYGTANQGGSSGNGTVFSLSFRPQLTITPSGTNVILSWPTNVAGFDYTGYTLQSAPAITGTFTNLPAATSPSTNSITGAQKYFRLISN